MTPATQHDGLRLISGTEVKSLYAVGTVDGVAVLRVAGANGPGTAVISYDGDGAGNSRLAWRAPGSVTFGTWVDVSVDGDYLLDDGEDPRKWARVTVYGDYLPAAAAQASVYLADVFNNAIGSDDVTAAEAAAGSVETRTVSVTNASSVRADDVRAWIVRRDGIAAQRLATMQMSEVRCQRSVMPASRVLPVITGSLGVAVLTSGLRPLTSRARPASRIRAAGWLPTTDDALEIGSDGVSWYAPDTEDHVDVVRLGSIEPGASATLHVRRSIPAGMGADAGLLNRIFVGWTGL